MRERIEPLIEERAPWLFRRTPWSALVRPSLMRMLRYRRTLELGELYRDWPTEQILAHAGQLLCRQVIASGLEHVPAAGPALIVANHPTGIADGLVLHHVLAPVRSDLFVYANADILRVLPQLASLVVPVEWRPGRRSRTTTRATVVETRRAIEAGRLGLIFPSGRLAERRGLALHERPWMASAATIARRFDVPVVPVHIRARNSGLYYAFDAIHPTLRDVTLFHETLNKDRQPYRVTIGEPIASSSLPTAPSDGIEVLRRATLILGGDDGGRLPLLRPTGTS